MPQNCCVPAATRQLEATHFHETKHSDGNGLLLCGVLTRTMLENWQPSKHSNDRVILYYTGFKNYKQFMLLYSALRPCVNHLPVNCHLKPQDQLFMTLIKWRLANDDFELSILFDLPEKVVFKVFDCWTNFIFYQLSEIDFWPSREIVSETMPMQFKAPFRRQE